MQKPTCKKQVGFCNDIHLSANEITLRVVQYAPHMKYATAYVVNIISHGKASYHYKI